MPVRTLTFSLLLAATACQSVSTLPEVDLRLDGGPAMKTRTTTVPGELRVSVAAMVSPAGTFEAYRQLLDQLGARLGTRVELVQRRTYRETNDLLDASSIDLAFLCTGGYLELLERARPVEVIAVPVVHGVTTYQSIIIVPSSSPVTRFEELEGKKFAFTDDLSLSGHAWPVWLARRSGHDPMRFFSKAYFTHSHDRSIDAVSKAVVDAAAVDGIILADMMADTPELGSKVRVVASSEPLGMPPVVASEKMPHRTRAAVREWLIALHEDPIGRELLSRLGIERFVVPPPGLYEPARDIMRGARP